MQISRFFYLIMLAGLLIASDAGAQTSPTQSGSDKQRNQGALPMFGPGSDAYKQNTQGTLPMVGPASGAYKQNTQTMAHSDPSQDTLK